MSALLIDEARRAHARHWALTPLRGKAAYIEGWTTASPPTAEQVEVWARSGNIGVRTGPISGLAIIDDDTDEQDVVERFDLPPTVTVETGSGRNHYYFRWPGCSLRAKLAERVDVLGKGRQAVFVGSRHPDTGNLYRWATGRDPASIELATLPREVLNRLRARPPRPPFATQGRRPIEFDGSLGTAAARVASAPEGARNTTLNREAFCAGLQVQRGWVSESDVVVALESAAMASGLRPSEVRTTLRSALSAAATADTRVGGMGQ